MLEKLKKLAETSKMVIAYILTPLIFIAGIIYYLLTKNSELKSELEQEKSDRKMEGIRNEKEKIDDKATTNVIDYIRVRDKFLESRRKDS